MSLVPFRDIVHSTYAFDADSVGGNLNNLSVPDDASHLALSSAADAASLGGIVATQGGRPLFVTYDGSDQLIIQNNSPGSDADNRIVTPTGSSMTFDPGAAVCLVYNGQAKRWYVVADNPGGGGGITVLNGLTDATQTLAAVDDTNVTLGITSAAGAHTFNLGWTGALSVARGGTGVTSRLMRVLDADATGVNGTSAQPWFPTSGAASIQSGKAYRISGLLMMTHGTTSVVVTIGFAGSATYTMGWSCNSIRRTDGQSGNTSHRAWRSSAAQTVISPASTVGGGVYEVSGIVRCAAQGTFEPQFQFSAAPGGTVAIKANSFFLMEEIGTNTVTTIGNW